MKALVLCGGIPQIELIKNLKARGITTILADMNERVGGRSYADLFYPVSVLDVDGVKELAIKEGVDFVITVCADQVLQVMAQVSEELGLPCYIDFETAANVSKKSYMKRIFVENGIPTSKHVIMDAYDEDKIVGVEFPIIVKPIDSYSSRGVRRVFNKDELRAAFQQAKEISRTSTVVVEEFVCGTELTVDIYVENGRSNILCISRLDKIPGQENFVINRCSYPAEITDRIKARIEEVCQNIATAFHIENSPMLVQLIVCDDEISIIEFCARTGGGDKFRLIKEATGFDVVDAVVELTLGNKPHVELSSKEQIYILDEFIYCEEGILDHIDGFEKAERDGVISEFYLLKAYGCKMNVPRSSGDRIAYFTVRANSKEKLYDKYAQAIDLVHIFNDQGHDAIRRDLFLV